MLKKELIKDTLGWGFILWLIGYFLGIVLFFILPSSFMGWIITAIGTSLSLWVLIKKVNSPFVSYYFTIAIVWTTIAVIFDYFFIVKLFKPADGYYKPDVYIYYLLTFALPLIVGWRKHQAEHERMVHPS